MVEIKEEDRVFGNVTWADLFTRQYWDIRYDGHACTPITRQDYPKDVCEKIIQQILQDHEDAGKYRVLYERCKRPVNAFISELEEQSEKDRQIVKRLEERIEKGKKDFDYTNPNHVMLGVHLSELQKILEGKDG